MLLKEDKESVVFFRRSVLEIAKCIFREPNRTFHIRLLEEETGFSTTAVTRAVEDLARYRIVHIEKTPLTKNVRADLNSAAYRFYKKVLTLYIIERYGLLDNLKEWYNPQAIVLFGSAAKGEDIEESDVDILILGPMAEPTDIEEVLSIYEKAFGRKISLRTLPSLAKSDDRLKNNIANGIVLSGYLKVIE